ncbi:putative tricarboxylic transport membrane protein [Constrictibacter sp. MBR-5]|jgi:putative tricarboxylic transport membrane protein|uniref:tripartite tricarboxylate transporter TctB family protein n=1 Tax=Constrictibacter sp. MBR-5 TaxID=3156467 RepID=UPI003391A2A6
MRPSDIGTGLLGLGLGLWLVYEGRDMGLGDLHEPGSGFILFWVGALMAALSALLAGSAVLAGAGGAAGADGSPFGERWRRVPLVLAYLVVYCALLEAVGFILLTIALLFLLFRTVDPQSWTKAVLYSVAITLAVYVLFGVGLGTQFPAGLLEPLLVG